MITAHTRGNKIFFDGEWRYMDGKPITTERPCIRCGRMPIDGYDVCLGHIEGAVSACCGHGVEDGYVVEEKKGVAV